MAVCERSQAIVVLVLVCFSFVVVGGGGAAGYDREHVSDTSGARGVHGSNAQLR